MLTPVAATVLVERPPREKIVAAVLFGLVFTARSLLQRAFVAWNESELLERAAASVLDGDVLRADVLPDQDVSLRVGQGVHYASQMLTLALPGLCADVLACGLLSLALAWLEPTRFVAVGAVALVASTAGLVGSRRALARAMERAWELRDRVYETFGQVLEGRLEIVAAGRRQVFKDDMGRTARAWSVAGTRVAAATILLGRLTLVAVAALVTGVLVANAKGESIVASPADLALFASIVPAFVGIARGGHEVVRDAHWLHFVSRVLRSGTPSQEQPTRPVPSLPAPAVFAGVSFHYPDADRAREALGGIDLRWQDREILALAGPNGSGKSTCLRMLLRLADPTTGAISVGGVALRDLDADRWRRGVAFLPQRPYLPPRADVRAALRWPVGEASDERIAAALDRVGLMPALRRAGGDPLSVRVDSLSVGERQRVALARLLCRDSALFLLDEPDANLDRSGIAVVAELLRELATRGMVAFAAHTPELLAAADRVIVLENGRVISAEAFAAGRGAR
jgi:ABC-type transport system involved in cytochrome bd biosynthesis fused ATPase/permease subunit